jgi:hypothetical protein
MCATTTRSTSTPEAAGLLAAAGIVTRVAGPVGEGINDVPEHLRLFVDQADRVLAQVHVLEESGEMDPQACAVFRQLLVEACVRVLCHPIVASNLYLRRFSQGVTFAQARHELQQFSVFAAHFDVAQAKLVANAPSLESYMERLKVLLNEKGIPYAHGFEGDLTGRWKLETVHFTWMRNMAQGLDLKFEELAKTSVALPGTQAFVNATFNYYAGDDQNGALGASFAIENWAANSLWKPWIAGMRKLNAELPKPVNLGYLTYHDSEEEHHSQATLDELLENFRQPWFDATKFLDGAERMLNDGVAVYYESQLATLPERDETWPERAAGDAAPAGDTRKPR